MFPHILESACYIDINTSEIHSGSCEKCIAHAQNIILILIGLGFFDMFRFFPGGGGGTGTPSIFIISEPIRTKFCTAIDQQSVSLNMK